MNKFKSLPVLLTNPKILLVGGGKVAFGKAKVLKENNIDFKIISLSVIEDIINLNIPFILKSIDKSDLKDYNIVIDATGSIEVRNLLLDIKQERFLLVNSVDLPQYCDFYFSALLHYKNLKIAVSSDGASPTISQVVRDRIKKYIPPELGEITERKLIERQNGIIDLTNLKEEIYGILGKVFIVGCGTGDPDLLTVKALKTISSVDVVLYDSLISDEILDLIPDSVEKIYAGKPKGSHHNDQLKINNILLEYALRGAHVARLKSGDPFVFGRGSEEAEFLLNHDIKVEIVPGISSALAAPLSAGIPVTARGYASGFTVVTGCLKGEKINYDWLDLLNKKNHTTILLMGLTYIDKIVSEALSSKINKDIPCAIITNATRKTQHVIISSLEDLPRKAKNASGPAVIVFGDVVRLSEFLPTYECFFEEMETSVNKVFGSSLAGVFP
jgi:uroporphyrin-III C-methyltransferase/precorrin-2 dehydrogenase/sirohydrochlorin ferrochelatase